MSQNSIQDEPPEITTKRRVFANVSVCNGCCCGNTARGKPAVPLELLKAQWKALGIGRHVQLTISGCLGPCDLVNVVRISHADEDVWLGGLSGVEEYLTLIQWAKSCREMRRRLPLPSEIVARRFDPFRCSVEGAS